MLRRWKQWRERRRIEKSRKIFEYWDGAAWRHGDPFRLWRGLMNHPKLNMETMLDAVDRGDEPETTITVEAVCDLFGLHQLDTATGKGLTDDQVVDVLFRLATYFETQKKTSNPGLISSSPTGQLSPSVTDSPQETTPSSVDSTPANTEPSSVLPTEPSLP